MELQLNQAVVDSPNKNTTKVNMEPSWLEVIGDEFNKTYMDELRAFLKDEVKNYTVYPPMDKVFNAFWKTPFDKVKVVILGQDPYHGPRQAHGLCFSVQKAVPPPPSLQNIFKEINRSLGIKIPNHGCLEDWAEQGVFLLNTVLTVRSGQPQSHAKQGWEAFTDRVIQELNNKKENLVFLLWGSPARKKAEMIDRNKHFVLEAAHPSPLSVHRGFFGCDHFKKANEFLKANGEKEIGWQLRFDSN